MEIVCQQHGEDQTYLLFGCQLRLHDVISTVFSFLFRQFGIKNGMFFGYAKQLCPNLQAVPYDFHAYKEVAQAMYETLARYCIQPSPVYFFYFTSVIYYKESSFLQHFESHWIFLSPVIYFSACQFDNCLSLGSFSNWEFSLKEKFVLHHCSSATDCDVKSASIWTCFSFPWNQMALVFYYI